MKGFGPQTFGKLHADTYDALHDPGTIFETIDDTPGFPHGTD